MSLSLTAVTRTQLCSWLILAGGLSLIGQVIVPDCLAQESSPPSTTEDEILINAPPLHEAYTSPPSNSIRSTVKPQESVGELIETLETEAEKSKTEVEKSKTGADERKKSKSKAKLRPLELEIETPRSLFGSINLRWNQALTSQVNRGSEAQVNFEISPKVEGKLLWQGTRSATFKPSKPWPRSTTFTITVKGEMTAVSGAKLDQDFSVVKRFSTERNLVRQATLSKKVYQQDEIGLTWTGELDDDALIKLCLAQKVSDLPSLSVFRLWKIKGEVLSDELRVAYDLDQQLFNKDRYYRSEQCLGLKILDPIEPFAKYMLRVSPGLPASEGPLLSTQSYTKIFHSESKLALDSVSIERRYVHLNFNRSIKRELLDGQIYILPEGQNPNRMSAKELATQQRLKTVITDDSKEDRPSENHYFNYVAKPTESVSVWIRPYAVRLSERNSLTRESLTKISKQADRGYPWLLAKTGSPDLGSVYADSIPSFITVEQLNQPTHVLTYYGYDHLCLDWYHLEPRQVAEYDLMRSYHVKLPKELSLPREIEPVCENLFDPKYLYRRRRFPVVPYRFAVRGSKGEWSFVEGDEELKAKDHDPSEQLVQRSTLGEARRVNTPCTSVEQPCGVSGAEQSSFYRWGNQQPALVSGTGAHLYLLDQRWRWEPKNENISFYSYGRGEKGHNGAQISRKHSLVQATRYGLIAKLNDQGGQVWVWDLFSNETVKDAKIKVYASGGARVGEARTDAQGIATLSLDQEMITAAKAKLKSVHKNDSNELILYVSAEHLGDHSMVSSSEQHRILERGDYYQYNKDNDYLMIGGQWREIDQRRRGQLWSDRGIYRPGDKIYVGGVIAEVNTLRVEPIRLQTCSLALRDRDQKEIQRLELKSSRLGTISAEFQLSKEAKLGQYQLLLDCLKANKPLIWTHELRVAAFRRPQFKVDASNSAQRVLSGDHVELGLRAQYLYGAPMSDKSWRAYLSAEVYEIQASGKRGKQGDVDLSAYRYGPPIDQSWGDSEVIAVLSEEYPQYSRYSYFNYESESLSGELDANGEANERIAPEVNGLHPYRLNTAWSVTDSDDQVSSAQSHLTVHPTTGYIGLRSVNGSYAKSGQEQSAEVIWLDSLTDQLGQARDIEVKLFHVTWSRIALKDEIGRERIENQRKITEVGGCVLTSVSEPKRCALTPTKSGEHIWVASAKDDRGHETLTAVSTYLYGGPHGSWIQREGADLELRVTDETPQIGDQIGILVESPYEEAEAWITVEREEIVYSKRQRIKASEMVYLPITEEMAPNAWVKVTLVRPRTALPYLKSKGKTELSSVNGAQDDQPRTDFDESGSFDLGRPVERYGWREIKVALTPAELKVSLSPDAKEKRPGEDLSIYLLMRDHKGQPVHGEVFVWALDEGVARLTGYKAPQLFDSLHRNRINRVKSYSHFSELQSHYTLGRKGNPVGGGGEEGEGGESQPRADFRATPFFVGRVKVDSSGLAKITRSLPDDLTTFKLFAVAVSEREGTEEQKALLRVGTGESKVTVNLPLMIRPALPRTMTVGDRLQLGAVVSSLLSSSQKLSVRFEVEGPAKALGRETLELDVPSRGNVIARAPYLITGFGDVKVKLTLYRGDKVEDIVSETVSVKAAALAESFAQSGELLASDSEESAVLIDLRSSEEEPPQTQDQLAPINLASELSVDLGVSAVNMIFGDLVGLLEYPYGCLEQRSSRALPYALTKALNLPIEQMSGDDSKSPQDVISDYLSVLETMQRSSGGLAYWANPKSRVHKWASSYAYVVLNELKRVGFEVSQVDLGRLQTFLQRARIQGDKQARGEHSVHLDTAAFIAFALSEYARPDLALEERLIEESSKLGLSAKLFLAASLGGTISKPSRGARRATALKLYTEAMEGFTFDGERVRLKGDRGRWSWWSFDSAERQIAVALIATLRVKPDGDLTLPLLMSLGSSSKSAQRLNTQAAAFKLLAMRDYVKQRESVDPKIHVDLSLLEKKGNQRSLRAWKSFDLDQNERSKVSAQESIRLVGEMSDHEASQEALVEGIKLTASGQGRLYFSQRLKRYPQHLETQPIDRGYTLQRTYSLEIPAGASDEQLRALYRTDLSKEERSKLRPQSLSYQLGDTITVELTVDVPHEAHYFVINDPLPSGLEIVDPSLKGASVTGPSRSASWSIFDHIELRDDRVLLFADRLPAGRHTFRYLVRATTTGRFLRPAAIAHEMYEPQNMGRSDGGYLWVRQGH